MSKSLLSKLIPVGKVAKAHGIKGELKFFLYNSKSILLLKEIQIWFKIDDKFKSFTLVSHRGTNGEIVRLNKVNDRNEANLLKGKEFFVSRNDFPNVEKGNFYLNDIINFIIFFKKKEIGFVSDVLTLPAGNVVEVNIKGKDVLIPMVDKYIEFFDFDKKIIAMKNIKELINL